MVEAGYISDEEARAARAEPLHFQESAFPIEAPHFVNYVRDLLAERFGADAVDRGGLRVYTTLDLGLQNTAEALVRRQVADLRDHDVSNGALVALDPSTGQIRAMVGSAGYFDEEIDGQINMALAPRQPGSSIKPITYAAALERGYTAATPLADVRTAFLTRNGELYVPQNYDATFHGLVSIRYALASSYNVPAVRMMDEIGVDAVLQLARDLGITTLGETNRFDLSLTLGGGEVRLLDLTAAYAAFASRRPAPRPGGHPASGGRLRAGALRMAARPRPAGAQPPDGLHPHGRSRRQRRSHARLRRRQPAAPQPARRRQDGHDHRLPRQLDAGLHAQPGDRRLGGQRRQPADAPRLRR